MRDPIMERATLAAKRDFDLLPRSAEIAVQPARRSELGALARHGKPAGARSSDYGTGPRAILQLRPRQHSDVQSKGQTAWGGGVSLSQRPRPRCAHSRRDEFDASGHWTARRFLRAGVRDLRLGDRGAGQGDGGTGQRLDAPFAAAAGAGRSLRPTLQRRRAQPEIAIGFEPIPSYQHDLWRYQRPWNRVPLNAPTAQPARSFADARH